MNSLEVLIRAKELIEERGWRQGSGGPGVRALCAEESIEKAARLL